MSGDPEHSKLRTPDQIVAELVVAALQQEGLLREAQAKTVGAKLVTGKLSAEDWSLEIELALAPKEATE